MKRIIRVFSFVCLLNALIVRAAEPSFDQWADQFAAEWARAHPQMATRIQYFEGAEQDAIDRRMELEIGVKAAHKDANLARRGLKELQHYPSCQLSPIQRTSAEVIRWSCERAVENEEFARHKLVFEHFRGLHVTLIQFLTTIHPIRNQRDAENYLARLALVGPLIDEGISEAESAAQAGFIPPRFILQRSIDQLDNFTTNALPSNPFVASFKERLAMVGDKVCEGDRRNLVAAAEKEVRDNIVPAYARVSSLLKGQIAKSSDDAGLWRLPNGEAAYRHSLEVMTTTSLSPDEIHQIGLREVARIESDMDVILQKLGYREGSVEERKAKVEASLPVPSGPDPRAALLEKISEIMRDAERRSETAFDLRPKAPVIVKREPEITESTAAAHYSFPAPDGSQPGIYWLPMPKIDSPPIWLGIGLKTVAYHEAIPGHHFQRALQQEMTELPRYRKRFLFGFNSAYVEGWALYAERLAMENDWYGDDLVGQLGFLDAQLLRARRLVVDTGLHAKKWSRQQVIEYGISPQETERYIVMQGQACSYMIGQLRILELREKSKKLLGDRFDIKQFHNTILSVGCVPLEVLEQEIDRWIEDHKR